MSERLILVYDADSGLRPMLLDVLKKAVGREDCPLCEITYSPLGKRREWKACETRLGVQIVEMHRDRIPGAWGIGGAELPCVLIQRATETPTILIPRDEIVSCGARVEDLEQRIQVALGKQWRAGEARPPLGP